MVWGLRPEPASKPQPLVRMTLALEPNEKLVGPNFAFSPDGTRLAYVAT